MHLFKIIDVLCYNTKNYFTHMESTPRITQEDIEKKEDREQEQRTIESALYYSILISLEAEDSFIPTPEQRQELLALLQQLDDSNVLAINVDSTTKQPAFSIEPATEAELKTERVVNGKRTQFKHRCLQRLMVDGVVHDGWNETSNNTFDTELQQWKAAMTIQQERADTDAQMNPEQKQALIAEILAQVQQYITSEEIETTVDTTAVSQAIADAISEGKTAFIFTNSPEATVVIKPQTVLGRQREDIRIKGSTHADVVLVADSNAEQFQNTYNAPLDVLQTYPGGYAQ